MMIPSLCPLTEYGVISVSGPHAARFLQGQITIDVMALPEQVAQLCAVCNNKGRVLVSVYIIKRANEYLLLTPHGSAPYLLEHLKKYVVAARVSFVDRTTTLSAFALLDVSDTAQIPYSPVISVVGADQRHLLLIPTDESSSVLTSLAAHYPIVLTAWQAFNIAHGIAEIFPETSGLFTPQALNYQKIGAVSFTKGCYIGQEIISRLHYRGHSKEQCFHLDFSSKHAKNHIPMPGDIMNDADGNALATIIACDSKEAQQNYHTLAVMQVAQANELKDKALTVTINTNEYFVTRTEK